MSKSLDSVIADIDKVLGKGTVQNFEEGVEGVEWLSSGSISLDCALGGGYPKGRIIEAYGSESSGKSTAAIHVCVEVQKEGNMAAYLDFEHAFDMFYAQNLGLDISKDKWLFSQPNCGEDGFTIIEKLLEVKEIGIIVVDSIAAMIPRAEIDGDFGDSKMGLHARLMSQGMRKLVGKISKSDSIVFFINQTRDKIGVVFGCLHADTLVNLVDGRSLPIRKIVDNKIKGEVWSWNEKQKEYEAKEIIDWHYNGDVNKKKDYIHFQTNSINGRGRFGFTVTPDHKILTKEGWKKAKDVNYQDKIFSKYNSKINGSLKDFLYGTFVGDCSISIRDKNTASMKFEDSNNKEYVLWKINKLKKFYNFTKIELKNNREKFVSEYDYELCKIKKDLGNRDPKLFLSKENFSYLGLALWFMDDVHLDLKKSHKRYILSIKRLKNNIESLDKIKNLFSNIVNVNPTINYKTGAFCFNQKDTEYISKKIKTFIPKTMQYKLLLEDRGFYKEFCLINKEINIKDYVSIKQIRFASDRQLRQKGKYDISIKDNHNYLVGGKYNGVLVHNSPETTTGGNAMKFYASQRLEIKKCGQDKGKDGDVTNIRSRIKIKKNKVAPPFRQCEIPIRFGEGFDKISELIDLAVESDIIQKKGSWFNYGDTKLGQGAETVRLLLEDNPELFEEIELKVKINLGLIEE